MAFDVFHLLRPTAIVSSKRFQTAVLGKFIEAGLSEQKQSAARGPLQLEFDERGHLLRIVRAWVDGIRMPGEREEPFGLHFLNNGLPFEVLVARIGDLATRDLTRYKGTIQLHA